MTPPVNRLMATALLCLLGMLGNHISLPLFFGVDFIFGSAAAIIALALLGTWPAVIVGIAAGGYTMLLWGHPHAAIIFIFEICFVAVMRNRISQLTLADAFYWILIGIPLVLALYWRVQGLPFSLSLMIALKQTVNGILNSAVAMLIVIAINLLDRRSEGASLANGLFNVMLVSILVPGIVLIALESRQVKSDKERSMEETLRLISIFSTYQLRAAAPDEGQLTTAQGHILLLDMKDHLPFDQHVNIGFLNDEQELLSSIGKVNTTEGGQQIVSSNNVHVWLPDRGTQSLVNWWYNAYYFHREPVYLNGPIHSVLVEHAATELVSSLHQRNLRSFLILIVLTGISIIIAVIVSHAYSVPLIQLGRVSQTLAGDIKEGKNIHVPKSRLEELATLASSFRSMAASLSTNFKATADRTQQLEVISQQLSKYLSPQIYDAIFSGNQQVAITTTRKKLTVFFSDLKDFTTISSELQPEDLTYLLNSYFTEMSVIAIRHGATIDKFVGDAMVMFFGDPESKGVKEDARACVQMAMEMQTRMKELNMAWRPMGYDQQLEMRIGINTGYCDVGNFGSDQHMDYTIIGAEVNIAARLENAADPGGILMSNETHILVRDIVEAAEQDSIQMKGVRRKVRAFSVSALEHGTDDETHTLNHQQTGFSLFLDPQRLTSKTRKSAGDKLKLALLQLEDDN